MVKWLIDRQSFIQNCLIALLGFVIVYQLQQIRYELHEHTQQLRWQTQCGSSEQEPCYIAATDSVNVEIQNTVPVEIQNSVDVEVTDWSVIGPLDVKIRN